MRSASGATGLLTAAALDGPGDVVRRHGVLLGLLNGVEQGGVTGGITTAGTGGDLDVLDEAGEELAALGVNGGLLVLGGGPLGVTRHKCSLEVDDEGAADRAQARRVTMETKTS